MRRMLLRVLERRLSWQYIHDAPSQNTRGYFKTYLEYDTAFANYRAFGYLRLDSGAE